jgi:hypothetical protein
MTEPSAKLKQEYRTALASGLALNVIAPAITAISVLLFVPGLDFSAQLGNEHKLFAYALTAFSLTICLIARVLHGRMLDNLKRQIKSDNYKNGRLLISYIIFFLLLLIPVLWGVIYYLLTRNALVPGFFFLITLLSYLFVTPRLEDYFEGE